ncbi:MAG: hypothetical protein ABI882_17235, partial [Acidobacteriota bacterium]
LGIVVLLFATGTVFGQTDDRSETLGKILNLRSELKVLEDKFHEPARADYEKYREFLKRPGTGLIRLMPREIFDKPEKSTIRGGGAYYSFIRKTHEYGRGSDIELSGDRFSVGFAGADYGVIGVIPEGDIDSVTLEHPAAKSLASLKTPTLIADARATARRMGEGGLLNGMRVGRGVRAEVGRTYVLRSIDYDSWDILVCFQVARKDSDGSYILAWKMLKEFDKPLLNSDSERTLSTITLGEYKVIRMAGLELNEETLNKLALEGWELVAVYDGQGFLRRKK